MIRLNQARQHSEYVNMKRNKVKEKSNKRRINWKMVETQNVAANSVCSDISLAHESDADEFPPDAAPDDGRARGRRGDEDGWRGQGGGGEDGDDGEGNGALDRCPLPARPDRRMPPFFPPHQATYRIASPHALFARPAMHGPGDTPKEGQTSNTALGLQALSSRESPASRLFTFITILTLRIPPQTIREE